MSYNTPKVINVFYKEDRKPYDINGKSVSYFGEDFIGSNDSTKIRFYLQPNLPLIDFTGIVHAKRADGEVRFELLEKSSNELGNYFELSLNSWFTMKTGKVTLSLKLYTGDVTFGYTEEIITSIESIEDAIVYASDIFTFNVGYAPNATEVVPPFIDGEFEQLLFALSGKPDIGETIYVVSELPTLTGGAYDDQWFLVKGINSFGKLYHIVDSVAEEVELGAGTFRVTPSGNGDIDQGTIAGQLKWNEDTGTINMGLFDEVEVGVGESLFWYVKANEPISRGDVVQFAGNVGGEIVVKKAVFAEITNQPDLLMGVCLREIDDGRKGYILSVGRLNNVNTDAFSTPILYLSTTTNGALSSTKPTSGFKGSVSAVGRFSTGGGNNGFLLVRPNLIKGLKEATDVTITDIVNGEILRWNGSNWVNSDSLSVAEDDIDALETRADLIEGRLDVVEPIVAQHTIDISDLDNRIDFIEDNGGIDFIKVATFSALPTSGDVRNHRLFLTEDTKQLWEFDGTQYNETSPKNLSNIVVSSEDDTTALRVVADATQDEDVVSVEIDEEKQVWIEKDGKFNALNEANFYDNVTIAGNLTINGTTTTVNTTTLDVEDNIITINKNQTGTPETNLLSGIEVERGDETNFQFVFQESSDLFKVGQVGDLQAVATRQDAPTDFGVAYFNTTTNRFETTTNLKVNASGQLVDTTIRNTGTTVVPLTVDAINSTTADLQQWRVNNVIRNVITSSGYYLSPVGMTNTTFSNGRFEFGGGGNPIIIRNVADANPSLIVNLANSSSTGNIANFQFAGANKLEITKDGFLTQNGTRLFSQPVATSNTFFGNESGGSSVSGTSNTSFGRRSLFSISSGTQNTSVGQGAGRAITSGSSNTFIGNDSGFNSQLATANNSTAIGNEAYTDASNQMVFGNANVTQFKFDRNANSIIDISTINKPIADSVVITQNGVPILSTYKHPTGSTAIPAGENTFVGRAGNTTMGSTASLIAHGSFNTAVGMNSFINNSLGGNNTAIGHDSLRLNTTGSNNLASGNSALRSNTTGNSNTATGFLSLFSNTTGSNNVASGLNALRPNTTGSLNVALGSGSGRYIADGTTDNTTGSNSVFLGSDTKALANGQTNQIVIGHNATGIGSNTVVLGNDSITTTALKGNVGIGTSAPATLLSVVTSSNTEGIQIRRDATSTNAYSLLGFRIATSNSATNYAEIRAVRTNRAVSNDTDLRFYTLSNNSLTEPMRIRDDGLVGINETAPTAQLQVKSGAVDRVGLIVDTLADHTADITRFSFNSNLRFGFNTSGFLRLSGVHNISSSNNSFVNLESSGTTISRNVADANTALIINQVNSGSTGDILKVQATGTDRLVVKQNGLVSINEATPTAQLQVKSGSTSRVPIIVDSLTSHLQNLQEWKYGGNLGAFVDNEGNFFNENGTYGTISDQRLKENIVDSRNYIDDLMKLRVVKYSLKEEKSTQPTHLGFIAQEFEQVFPKMIGEFTKEIGKDIEGNAITEKYKSIKMSVLIPMLVKTIQELNKKVEELEEKIK
jgi:trimeric autotransporter adhesin